MHSANEKSDNQSSNEFVTTGTKSTIKKIYRTLFKKGNIVESLHFEHAGELSEAVSSIKTYLKAKHLKHIHTVPFLIDPEDPNALKEDEDQLEGARLG